MYSSFIIKRNEKSHEKLQNLGDLSTKKKDYIYNYAFINFKAFISTPTSQWV